MTLDIEKIKTAAMAATQGEWKAVRSIPEEGFECFWLMHNDAHFGDIHGPQSGQQLADAEHIATANPQAVLELITRLEAAEKDAVKYQELIYAVGRKFPDETRHETALKYIRQMEEPSKNAAMKVSA